MSTPVWDIQFNGQALIDGQPLRAAVYLRDGEPIVVGLSAIPTLTVSALFNQFFAPTLTWPADILDLSLSDSSIFYTYVDGAEFPPTLPEALLSEQSNVPGEGLYAAATATLVLAGITCPPLATHVRVITGQGLTVDGTLTSPVTLWGTNALILTGADLTGGPSLSVSSFGSKRGFTLSCGITLLGSALNVSSTLQVTRDGSAPPALAGTLSHTGTLGPFTNPSIAFTWTQAKGFGLQNFPRIPIPDPQLDFLTLLKAVSHSRGCGEMVQLAFNRAITTSLFLAAKVSTTAPSGSAAPAGQVYLIVNGYYKLSTGGQTVAEVDLPELSFGVALAGLSFSSIVSSLGDAIEANGKLVVEALWDDRAELTKFLAVFVAKDILTQLAEGTCSAMKSLLDALTSALAGLGAGAGLSELLGAAAAANQAQNYPEHEHGGGGGGDGGGGGSPVLSTPTITKSRYAASVVTVDWNAVGGAAGYQVWLTNAANALIGTVQQLGAVGTTTLPVDVATAGYQLTVKVRALPDATSDATQSGEASASVLFTGVGFSKVGTTFKVS